MFTGKCLAAASILPLHPGTGQHNPIHNDVIIPTNEKFVHSGVPKLLVGEALPGEYVQRSTQGDAEVPIGIESTADDP
ncbi:dna primase [Lasius niger]|uniref:Dna primase n=1 Tax=Lasius niger TaxID=67767 RepID=A0A0J7KRA3_LASNI|nr:dna primase [Lasius niger]